MSVASATSLLVFVFACKGSGIYQIRARLLSRSFCLAIESDIMILIVNLLHRESLISQAGADFKEEMYQYGSDRT
jgi:hypothetical protein